MDSKVNLAVCSLNQWSIDFQGNFERIKQGFILAKASHASYCLTPELSLCGYGCEDHFYENDTQLHCWQMLEELLQMDESKGMICDVGMPVTHKSGRYNCRIIFMYKKILLIRPKLHCCNQGNYRELRWFTPWFKQKTVENFHLPRSIKELTGQSVVAFGDAVLATKDTCIGSEICEELWTSLPSHIPQSLDGVEIFTNSSGSHFVPRKAHIRVDQVRSATFRVSGAYMYSNQMGCDGGRLFFDGGSMIALNGEILTHSSQFALNEVEVNVATIDLGDIRSRRTTFSSHCFHSSLQEERYPRVTVDFSMSPDDALTNLLSAPTPCIQWKSESPEVELAKGPACWLWDYLRRSGQSGFFLPLSGGVDSSSVACMVFSMCHLVHDEVQAGNEKVLADVRKIVNDRSYKVTCPENLCHDLLTTCYMGSENSSDATKKRASDLAHRICSNHLELRIDTVVRAVLMIFTAVTGFIPKFKVQGGSPRENLAMQNIQARIRMVLAYLFAQLMQWVRGRSGSLLVLGSANVDESLRGYYTKYDCSSADINPIGGISKKDLKSFIHYFMEKYNVEPLREIAGAPPTAELEPLNEGEVAQTDEADMGMTYDELSVYGKLRKISNCGPYCMFSKLVHLWKETCSPIQVAEKVKHFFRSYSINRHKMTTLTPAMHAEDYSPDDNRFDLRPFLYNSRWSWQFRKIDQRAAELNDSDEFRRITKVNEDSSLE